MNNNNLAEEYEEFEDDEGLDDDDLELDIDELIEKYRYVEVESDWWSDQVTDDWAEKLEALGYTDPKIQFSGFCSQGGGASFTSGYDIDKFIDNNKPLIIQWLFPQITDGIDDLKNYLSIYVTRNSHQYSHKHTCELMVDVEGEPEFITEEKLEDIATELESTLECERQELCDEIYKSLEAEYNYMTSDECIKEYLINNELWEEPEVELEVETERLAA